MIEDVIKGLLKDHQPAHSEYQIDHFIIGKSGDAWAQYKQCLREISARWDSLQTLREDLELLDAESGFEFWRLKKPSAARIAAARKDRRRAALLQSVATTERELEQFVDRAQQLKAAIGDVDDVRRGQLERASWYATARKTAAVEMFCAGTVSKPTMEFILSLTPNERFLILQELKKRAPEIILEIE